MPSPGGQANGMAGRVGVSRLWVSRVRHPVDLPEGYHATTRGQSCTRYVGVCRGLPPGRRVVGLRQVDGMPHEPRRGRATDRRGSGASYSAGRR